MFKKFLMILLAMIAASAFAAVDINKANQAELESVKGIGPAISAKILDERKKGDFKDWNDLITRVKGVGEHNSAKFSDGGLTVNGTTYKGVPAKAMEDKAAKKEAKAAVATPAAPAPATAPAAKAATAATAAAPAAASTAAAADGKAAGDKKGKKEKKASKADEKAAAVAEAKASGAKK